MCSLYADSLYAAGRYEDAEVQYLQILPSLTQQLELLRSQHLAGSESTTGTEADDAFAALLKQYNELNLKLYGLRLLLGRHSDASLLLESGIRLLVALVTPVFLFFYLFFFWSSVSGFTNGTGSISL